MIYCSWVESVACRPCEEGGCAGRMREAGAWTEQTRRADRMPSARCVGLRETSEVIAVGPVAVAGRAPC